MHRRSISVLDGACCGAGTPSSTVDEMWAAPANTQALSESPWVNSSRDARQLADKLQHPSMLSLVRFVNIQALQECKRQVHSSAQL